MKTEWRFVWARPDELPESWVVIPPNEPQGWCAVMCHMETGEPVSAYELPKLGDKWFP